MTITLATPKYYGNVLVYSEGACDDADDVVVQTGSIIQYDTFELMSTSGALQVLVTLDGTNYTTAPLSLSDLGAAASAPVIVTVANRLYGFKGFFAAIRVTQNGATDADDVSFICGRSLR